MTPLPVGRWPAPAGPLRPQHHLSVCRRSRRQSPGRRSGPVLGQDRARRLPPSGQRTAAGYRPTPLRCPHGAVPERRGALAGRGRCRRWCRSRRGRRLPRYAPCRRHRCRGLRRRPTPSCRPGGNAGSPPARLRPAARRTPIPPAPREGLRTLPCGSEHKPPRSRCLQRRSPPASAAPYWCQPCSAPPGLDDVDSSSLRDALIAATTGTKLFPSDVLLPDMLHGRVLRPPGYGAALSTVDTSTARQMPGVIVVEDIDFVGVCAPTRKAASAALHAVQAEWECAAQPAEAELENYLRCHPADNLGWDGAVDRDIGDVDTARSEEDVALAATYTSAYIAHVPLEPRVALAQLHGDSATVWVGTQRPFGVRSEVAAALGLAQEQVRIVVPDFGGGFGGKHSGDVAVEAARLAQATGQPGRVSWTREEEFRWAYFRPAAVIDVRSSATRGGNLMSWEFTNINSGSAG